MDQIDKIKELILPELSAQNVRLYDVKWQSEKKMRILQIAIMKSDGSMDIDTCATVSEKLSLILDEAFPTMDEYFLEVCSPGAEREIRDLNELPELVTHHIYVRLKHPVKKMLEFTGDLLKVENDDITMNYRDKALTREVTFKQDEIEFCRLAVKL
ncbi:ribosome maturation factor RimP [Anaerorhabdus sp.]|jgi:ribosome maturation factor RimP|uniref:ribosome maturation factor RimP n=1 Tax=Anaerorhabdus sp. TaxID=1872524 RepID=UPI002FC702E7